MKTLAGLRREFRSLGRRAKADVLKKFFKTGPGEYAEGDQFLGITAPETRTFAKSCGHLSLQERLELLKSPFHEERSLALILLVDLFQKNPDLRAGIFKAYLAHTRYLNNWDFVDISAHLIAGAYLESKPRTVLYRLAESNSLWERRIAIVATWHFIRAGDLNDTFEIAKKLLKDKEDLIHKAAGWMLREAGKRDIQAAEKFLKAHYRKMPRTMLRYAIERLPEPRRKAYLQGKI